MLWNSAETTDERGLHLMMELAAALVAVLNNEPLDNQ
jgi:hypothetical protein